jgi:hypothetical protein
MKAAAALPFCHFYIGRSMMQQPFQDRVVRVKVDKALGKVTFIYSAAVAVG